MKTPRTNWLALAALMAGMGLSGSAHAVWTFDNATVSGVGNYNNCSLSTTTTCDDKNASNVYVAGSETGGKINNTTASLSGYYATNNASGVVNGKWTATPANTNGNGANGLAYFAGNGQGMYTGTDANSPYHALDNNINTEAVLLSFTSSTVLSSIGLGYVSNNGTSTEIGCKNASNVIVDTTTGSCGSGTGASGKSLVGTTSAGTTVDISLFRWTTTSAPTQDGSGNWLNGSWELVGNYGDMVGDTTNPYNLVNAAGKTSSWWLISAYNSGFATTADSSTSIATESRGTLSVSNDYFKLYSVAGTVCSATVSNKGVCGGSNSSVPEPASLALTGVALAGVVGLRRRKAKLAA